MEEKKVKRVFGGEMPTTKNSAENKFRKAHLKAYLKGKQIFNHGFTGGMPVRHAVSQSLV